MERDPKPESKMAIGSFDNSVVKILSMDLKVSLENMS